MNYELLRLVRKSRKITIKELSEKTGISRQLISSIEAGKASPNISRLEAICSQLGVKIVICLE